jgi:hypothetical protein
MHGPHPSPWRDCCENRWDFYPPYDSVPPLLTGDGQGQMGITQSHSDVFMAHKFFNIVAKSICRITSCDADIWRRS